MSQPCDNMTTGRLVKQKVHMLGDNVFKPDYNYTVIPRPFGGNDVNAVAAVEWTFPGTQLLPVWWNWLL